MIRSYAFAQGRVHSKDIATAAMPGLLAQTDGFLWIDLEKVTPQEALPILEGVFHFHPLSIEDCIADSPSPKVEEYNPQPEDKFTPYLFLVMHAVDYNRKDGVFATSELNLFLGKNFLVTYHDVPLRSIASVEERCAKGSVNISGAPDRLAHCVLDTMVENYKPALDELSSEIAGLEEQALKNPRPAILHRITDSKKEVLRLRQIIGPQSDVIARLARGEFALISPHLLPYYRDISDGLFHITTQAQAYADSLTGILQIYLSMSSNRTNDIVKVLTIITVLTMPLMIVSTWYGMNFKDMPELGWPHAYGGAMLVVALSTAGAWWYFKKKKWF